MTGSCLLIYPMGKTYIDGATSMSYDSSRMRAFLGVVGVRV